MTVLLFLVACSPEMKDEVEMQDGLSSPRFFHSHKTRNKPQKIRIVHCRLHAFGDGSR